MPGGAVETNPAQPDLECGNCRHPMRRLALAGHYGSTVELDLCRHCDLIWFDETETARLTGQGLLALIGAMAESYALPHETLRRSVACPRCAGPLQTAHSLSRWGRSLQLQCLRRHGAYQPFAQFLQEKGLLRPMSRLDRACLLQEQGRIDCVNCGAAVSLGDSHCTFCGSVPSLLDIARLARALDPEEAVEPLAVHASKVRQAALQCAACGAAVPPEAAMRCPQCGATLAVASLADAYARVQALAPALRAHAERPAPQVVRRRLDALQADLPRRRRWVDAMQRDARGEPAAEGFAWSSLFRRETNPVRAALIALLGLLAWRWFTR